MSQRNPNNPRNQARQLHHDGLKGVSRKSASSAKPKRAAGTTVYTPSSKTKKSRLEKSLESNERKEQRSRERRRERALGAQLTDMPEYKFWRRIWWVVLAVAVVACVLAFVVGQMRANGAMEAGTADILSPVLMVLGYGGIIAALFIDLVKIRRMRKDLEAQAHTMSRKQLRKLDAAIEEDDKRYEEEMKQGKGFRMPWSKRGKTAEEPSDTAS